MSTLLELPGTSYDFWCLGRSLLKCVRVNTAKAVLLLRYCCDFIELVMW